ncbi:hypothetical protein GXW83_00710 [Streptacidiphilus sp. PB12-B1b]|uniref:hypothetical protein n=1 Tax=Streptacidiphilus sp. PB12-B1b TaxID=2705012 RepID=UPI0015FBA259|nr:hypothetical protein [Streptacidiphilus sp. PB12-B1b]QMU74526.1 hypothetical protein GXW83_00710 [Streptacidiphilus sp. PB12-B1b]
MTTPRPAVHVTTMLAEHADRVLAIHQLGIDEGTTAFETTAPTWDASTPPSPRPPPRHPQQQRPGDRPGGVNLAETAPSGVPT